MKCNKSKESQQNEKMRKTMKSNCKINQKMKMKYEIIDL